MKNIIYPSTMDFQELNIYKGNREVHLLRYFEPDPGLFIAEGWSAIDIALRQGYQPYNVVCFKKMVEDDILKRVGEVPIYVLEEQKANTHFGYVLTGGISCAMYRGQKKDYKEVLKGATRILVLEDVENPTNLGAIFRTAAALDMDGIILSPRCADPLYRRAIRVSMGNTFLVPWAYACDDEDQWEKKGIHLLKEEGFLTVGMAIREDNILIDDPRLKQAEKVAIIMGNEGKGLKASTIGSCDYVAKIPMKDGVDSLNVGVAAGIAMWELKKVIL